MDTITSTIQFILAHIDWLGSTLSLSGWFIMARNKFIALLVLICANAIWFGWSLQKDVLSLSIASFIFILLNIRTTYTWAVAEKAKPTQYQDPSYLLLKRGLHRLGIRSRKPDANL